MEKSNDTFFVLSPTPTEGLHISKFNLTLSLEP